MLRKTKLEDEPLVALDMVDASRRTARASWGRSARSRRRCRSSNRKNSNAALLDGESHGQPVLHRLFPQAHDLAIEDENGANGFQQAISAEGLADEGRVGLRQTFPTISRHKDEGNLTSVWPRSFNSVDALW